MTRATPIVRPRTVVGALSSMLLVGILASLPVHPVSAAVPVDAPAVHVAAAPDSSVPVRLRAGGFGVPRSRLPTLAATAAAPPAPAVAPAAGVGESGYGSSGGCSYYANNAGMGIYCGPAGESGVAPPNLNDIYDVDSFRPCRLFTVPPGMGRPPQDRAPPQDGPGEWMLKACITGIDWNTYDGGPDMQVVLSFYWAEDGEDTSYPEGDLETLMWSKLLRGYPVPLATISPTAVPRVGVPAYFSFGWVDEDGQPVSDGPNAGDPNGAPYREINLDNGAQMQAEVVQIEVDPQIEGVRPTMCGPDPADYDEAAGPDPAVQPNECLVDFPRSSAVADELSNAFKDVPDGEYPSYLVRIIVSWQVRATIPGGAQGEQVGGTFNLTAYQQVPVQEDQAVYR